MMCRSCVENSGELTRTLVQAILCSHFGEVSERFKEAVLKTVVGVPYRGFESHPLRTIPDGLAGTLDKPPCQKISGIVKM